MDKRFTEDLTSNSLEGHDRPEVSTRGLYGTTSGRELTEVLTV